MEDPKNIINNSRPNLGILLKRDNKKFDLAIFLIFQNKF